MMNRNVERMQYQSDKLSHGLCMLSIIFNVVYFVSIYTNKAVVPDAAIGADVIFNIVFMMMVFYGSEKLKAYEKKWNIYMMLAGVIQVLRIFWLPVHFNRLEMLVEAKYTLVIVWLLISGVFLLLAGINSSINLRVLSRLGGEGGVGE